MSHYRQRKEVDILPGASKLLTESGTLVSSDRYVLVNGPASSGAGSPGYTIQTDTVSWDDSKGVDGSSARYSSNDTIGITDQWTIGLWIKPTGAALTSRAVVFAVEQPPVGGAFDANTIHIHQSGEVSGDPFTVWVKSSNFSSREYRFGQILLDTWTYLTVTWDLSQQELRTYVNGSEVAPTKISDGTLNTMSDAGQRTIEIWEFNDAYKPLMTALSAAVWSVALTPTEIAATYNSNGGASFDLNLDQAAYQSSADLEHWWRFGHQDSPNIFVDYTAVGAYARTLDSTNIVNGDIQASDAPPGGAAVQVTLVDATSNEGLEVTIQDSAGNAGGFGIPVLAAGSDTIETSASDTIDTAFGAKTYRSDGNAQWRIVTETPPLNIDEENVLPAPAREISASAVLANTDSYVLVDGPSSTSGGPGFSAQLDSLNFDGVSYAKFSANATIGFITDISTTAIWLKSTDLTAESTVFYVNRDGFIANVFLLTQRGDLDGDPFEIMIGWPGNVGRKEYLFGQMTSEWTLLVLSYERSTDTLTVYQDGVAVSPTTIVADGNPSPDPFTDSGNMRIGFNLGGGAVPGSDPPKMICLSVAVWNKVLTSSEVSALYNGNGGGSFDLNFDQGLYESAGNLQHWWRLGHQIAPDIFADYADAATNPQVIDFTDISSGDIESADAPPGGSVVNVTLPDAGSNDGRSIVLQDKQGNAAAAAITVLAASGDTIDGNASDSIATGRGSKTYTSDGDTQWRIVTENTPATIINLDVSSVGETATMNDEQYLTVTTGGVTITLPDASVVGSGIVVYVKDRDGNATADPITIDTQSGQTIDGASTALLDTDYESVSFVSDGSDWMIL